ncbi:MULTISPECIES: hypothetical protein [Leptospira]|uniref:Uncharacterized protein n=4 Tax=Leptospira weilii TaxID=28184 RepID=A0A828Z229_9LEPT|nr:MULTISPECIES: hypothetical protein [Leptospira]EMM70644.1 hypothetical protein LEP1GSC038_1223 [Leptospira weilii str. 2006001855]EMY13896.1 hypothetical protein LEP1GSC043_3313 [Leptospira weilii str. Ecochallenge]EKR63808.1 hypothetical protein LEP1GSC036_1171 [Leptospira weilii str. 2006001853]EMJ64702.1 hypothetical protein LEP1GSC051_3272 [Leptospira sp. P2653]EMN89767.1 hypothetical protein LEP1GSC108_2657 [Leptospira weilii str. UI 13098]
MLELNELEIKILNLIPLEVRDVRKLGRILHDVTLVTGMTEEEIIEFIPFGLEDEVRILKVEYNFNDFKKALVSKLTKKNYHSPGLSAPIPDTLRQSF